MKLFVTVLVAGAIGIAAPARSDEDARSAARMQARAWLSECGASASDCESMRAEFLDAYLRAKDGSLRHQRAVAFALEVGQPPIRRSLTEACAWWRVINASGHRNLQPGDRTAMQNVCTRGAAIAPQYTEARSAQLLQEIRTSPTRMPTPR